ncbi:MAG TPA: hypothetical protein PLJ34_03120 [Hyphomicrobiales bacterium]|nr:hypothetical protein [Kaistiaceae bacterium]HQF30416.1 hypothetical protein [Hyphomicrobiales bacterium]
MNELTNVVIDFMKQQDLWLGFLPMIAIALLMLRVLWTGNVEDTEGRRGFGDTSSER